jgi:ornithine cyclodeaminase
MTGMLILTRSMMRAALAMPEAIETAAAALAAYSAGDASIPLRTHLATPGGVNLYMPGFLRSSSALGAKLVSVYPHNADLGLPTVLAVMVLQDAATGEPLAALEASFLTAVRTGAAGGVAIRHLARPTATKLLLIGAGAQGRTQVEAARIVRPISHVVVSDTNAAVAQAAAAEIAAQTVDPAAPLSIVASDTPDRWVSWADIIVCATTSRSPVFDGNLVRPGTHINAIGAYTQEMQELPASVVVRADLMVADAREAAWHEAGDLVIPHRQGLIGKDRLGAELGEVVLGRAPGRRTDHEITIYKGVGVAALDLATAQSAYARARTLGIGLDIDLLA